jgi:peptide-methionine (S)-S-oxide reductase
MQKVILSCLMAVVSFISCAQKQKTKTMNQDIPVTKINLKEGTEVATFAEGCFWCTESFFQRLEGVISVASGYSGGHVANPSYDAVCTKTTGHAEALHIVFDPQKISYDELLEVFWKTHDPTTLNQQGADVGPQYRSVVFYHSPEQKEKAEKYKMALDKVGAFGNPIVTAIEPFINFYAAEDYHQNFYNNNTNYGYCRMVIRPKLDKFEKVFKDKLKKN